MVTEIQIELHTELFIELIIEHLIEYLTDSVRFGSGSGEISFTQPDPGSQPIPGILGLGHCRVEDQVGSGTGLISTLHRKLI